MTAVLNCAKLSPKKKQDLISPGPAAVTDEDSARTKEPHHFNFSLG